MAIYSARMLAGLFSKDPETIARSFSPSSTSCEEMVSGVRLINFYLNHAAKGMNNHRRRKLEKARKLLSERLDHAFREREIEARKSRNNSHAQIIEFPPEPIAREL